MNIFPPIGLQQVRFAYLLVLVLSILRAASQFFFKLASTSGSIDESFTAFIQPTIWAGVVLQIISFPLLLQIHKLLPLSRAAPLIMSLPQVWTVLLGLFLLSERLDLYRMIGIGLILVGTIVVGSTQE